ncbi:hypothetical protein IV203_029791 [Nitzschia inconspicua]|uniref:Uncharacterized protein n=1 Tax=Nitzschia inconspicua TaxID=303405 RepID=A0A9K3K816_9STRA|nr:hypothetical protein IV203_004872 [Nitzschia inconspicua]KAG7367121.1 hypothetical protein IV203_029791 [Nitzschia inconspicua]
MQFHPRHFIFIALCLMTFEHGRSFICSHPRTDQNSNTALNALPNPFRAIRNRFRKPRVTANFPVNGKKVKLTPEKTEQLSKKYSNIQDVGDRAFEVIKDLELVDTKWKTFPKKA